MKLNLIILFALTFASCTTVRNAERRHDRIVKNFPNVHKYDTIEIEVPVYVEIPSASGTDTLYFTVNSIDTITDTIYVDNEIRIINTIWRDKEGRNALKTDVWQPKRKVETKVKVKVQRIYEKTPLRPWQKWWGIGLICIIMFINGWAVSEINKQRYDNK